MLLTLSCCRIDLSLLLSDRLGGLCSSPLWRLFFFLHRLVLIPHLLSFSFMPSPEQSRLYLGPTSAVGGSSTAAARHDMPSCPNLVGTLPGECDGEPGAGAEGLSRVRSFLRHRRAAGRGGCEGRLRHWQRYRLALHSWKGSGLSMSLTVCGSWL